MFFQKTKVIAQEAFVFEHKTKVYRCVSEPEGYQCPMCPKVFGQLGRHISSSKCGKSIDVKRFTAELKKKLKTKNSKKKRSANLEEYGQKAAAREKKSRDKKLEANSEECRKNEALKKKETRNKKLEENSEEFRKNKTLKKKETRKKKLEKNPEVCKNNEALKMKETRNKKLEKKTQRS